MIPTSVKNVKFVIASTELKYINTKHVVMQNHVNNTYMSSTKRPDTSA